MVSTFNIGQPSPVAGSGSEHSERTVAGGIPGNKYSGTGNEGVLNKIKYLLPRRVMLND